MRVAAVAALATVAALACGAATAARLAPGTVEIKMRGNSFGPRDATVALGDTVVWVNVDIVRHNAVRDGLFDSGELTRGERFEWVPADTGTVRYQCTIHSRMRGTLRIVAER